MPKTTRAGMTKDLNNGNRGADHMWMSTSPANYVSSKAFQSTV